MKSEPAPATREASFLDPLVSLSFMSVMLATSIVLLGRDGALGLASLIESPKPVAPVKVTLVDFKTGRRKPC